MPDVTLTTVKLRVSRDVWKRVCDEATRCKCSVGLVIAAAMDAYDASPGDALAKWQEARDG